MFFSSTKDDELQDNLWLCLFCNASIQYSWVIYQARGPDGCICSICKHRLLAIIVVFQMVKVKRLSVWTFSENFIYM